MASLLNMSSSSLLKKGSLLPSGYTQVEYIENTGYAYIDTGYILDFTETINIKISVSDYVRPYGGVFGNYKDERSNITRIIQANGDPTHAYCYFNNRATAGGTYVSINGLNQINEYSLNSHYCIVNGIRYDQSTVKGDDTFNDKIYLFSNLLTYAIVKAKLYHFEITSHRNMVPCINPNNVVGMYDTVEGKFYSSPNGVAFVAGPVVS